MDGSRLETSVLPDWAAAPREQRLLGGLFGLALATVLSFGAGVGTTLLYLQQNQSELIAPIPLIQADKTPTRVRPEGRDERGTAGGLTSTALAKSDDSLSLPIQGIPDPVEITPPTQAHVMVELPASGDLVPEPASEPVATAERPVEPAIAEPDGPSFRVQLASMRSAAGAAREKERLNRLFAAELSAVELTVERSGPFYRVWSVPLPERAAAAELCSAVAARHGQCLIVATTTASTAAPVAAAPTPSAKPVVEAPARPVAVAPPSPTPGVRVQLGSMRSLEGAQKELSRLARIHADAFEGTALSVSKIDLGGRGVFYRILTAPFPDRTAAGDLCHRLENQAGCVLVNARGRTA